MNAPGGECRTKITQREKFHRVWKEQSPNIEAHGCGECIGNNPYIRSKKLLILPFLVIRDRFKVDKICTGIFCNLFDLHLPEVGRFNLQLATSDSNNSEMRLFDSFSYLLTFPYIQFHVLHLKILER